jgi:two-component system, NarL family, response regulator
VTEQAQSASAAQTIRVLCVDDHQVVREGVALIIAREADMQVVGSAATGQEAVTLHQKHRPDITLMDLQLGAMSGLQAIEVIRARDPHARIIVLTMYEGDEHIYRALAAGATTYLLKDTLSDDLIRIVREVHAGHRPIPPAVQARLEARATQPALTAREIQVMQLVVEGRRNKEIASALQISEETVQVHLKNVFSKLHVNDRTAALNIVLKRGIVQLR